MKKRKILFVYEPILVPYYDPDGNIAGYTHPIACPNSLDQLQDLRQKSSCAEGGLSANPKNVTGFRRLCDVINQNRNIPQQQMFANYGYDDLSIMAKTTESISKLKSASKSDKK